MSFLEKKIRENKEFFDDQPMPAGHRKRFLDKLEKADQEESKKIHWPGIIRMAAVLLILVSSFFVFKNISFQRFGGAVLEGVTMIAFPEELESVFNYYDRAAQQKVEEIDQAVPNDAEALRVKALAEKQLQALDASLAKIEKEYMKNPENEKVKAALVNNKRQKERIMETILAQLDQAEAIQQNPAGNLSE
ncbi:MAG TPA: hypothetical protein VFC92_07420 [Bacteroidales bacterium]|nr:hypothetical protein [Bacteroidales bacterium]